MRLPIERIELLNEKDNSVGDMMRVPLKCLVLLSVLSVAVAEELTPKPPAATPESTQALPLPLDDLRKFVEVFERIRVSYVDPVDDRTLFVNAIKGMLSALDPHSNYLDKQEYADLQRLTTGEFDGIGLELGVEDGAVKIIAPLDDSPAAKAGIQAGDYIVKVNQKSLQGMSLADVLKMLSGKAGSKVTLSIFRKDEEVREIEITRAKIEVSSVKMRALESDIYVARISQFQQHTGRDLKTEIEKIKRAQKNIKGLVIDLRNNPGGVLDGAIAVSDLFLNEGVIVSTKSRTPENDRSFTATEGDMLEKTPIVVLINGGSASASEIVSGALQDHHRAIIVGTTSFGKGSVQTVLPLTEGLGIKLTTARYYTPSGRSIQAEGIKPDIVVQPAAVNLLNTPDSLHEADLQGHLVNDKTDKAPDDKKSTNAKAKKSAKTKEVANKPLLETDFQLAQALLLLKASAWQMPASPSADIKKSPDTKDEKPVEKSAK